MSEKKGAGSKRASATGAKSGGAKSGGAKKGAATTTSASGARGKRGGSPAAKRRPAGTRKGAGGPAASAAAAFVTAGGAAVAPSAPPPVPLDANSRRREAAKKTALAIAVAALDKKAERVEIIDIGEKVDYADFLVVMTGRSDRQVQAIARGIEDALRPTGQRAEGVEGMAQGQWVLLNYSDVIVHVFLDEARKYYDLEGLWIDAPRVPAPSFVARTPSIMPGDGG